MIRTPDLILNEIDETKRRMALLKIELDQSLRLHALTRIVNLTAEAFGVEAINITSENKNRHHTDARHAAIVLAHRAKVGYQSIQRHFNVSMGWIYRVVNEWEDRKKYTPEIMKYVHKLNELCANERIEA